MKEKKLIAFIFRCIALAMSTNVIVLNILGEMKTVDVINLLAIGLFCLSISNLESNK